MFLDKTIFLEILAPYNSTIRKESFISHPVFNSPSGPTNATRMNIQPMSAQMTLMVDGQIGKTFTGFTAASGIVEGMRITVSGTNQQYNVKGRQNYEAGPLPHNEVILFRRDPQ